MTSDLTSALEVSHIMRYTNRRILYLLYNDWLSYQFCVSVCLWQSGILSSYPRSSLSPESPVAVRSRQKHVDGIGPCGGTNYMTDWLPLM